MQVKHSIINTLKFTKKEYANYTRQKGATHFSNPEEEYAWASEQKKNCSKCSHLLVLTAFQGNCSGRDAFDKSGYRLRRPECVECQKNVSSGKTRAKKIAASMGISYEAPEGTRCAICDRPPTKGNGLVFDHCHVRNVFRGYCCNSCNRSLGVLGDDKEGILNVMNYILRSDPAVIFQGEGGMMCIEKPGAKIHKNL